MPVRVKLSQRTHQGRLGLFRLPELRGRELSATWFKRFEKLSQHEMARACDVALAPPCCSLTSPSNASACASRWFLRLWPPEILLVRLAAIRQRFPDNNFKACRVTNTQTNL